MPAFRYEAVDAGGVPRKGVLNADSARGARADLRLQGLTPLTVEAIAAQLDDSGARAAMLDKMDGFLRTNLKLPPAP